MRRARQSGQPAIKHPCRSTDNCSRSRAILGCKPTGKSSRAQTSPPPRLLVFYELQLQLQSGLGWKITARTHIQHWLRWWCSVCWELRAASYCRASGRPSAPLRGGWDLDGGMSRCRKRQKNQQCTLKRCCCIFHKRCVLCYHLKKLCHRSGQELAVCYYDQI